MNNKEKTKEQMIEELNSLRKEVEELRKQLDIEKRLNKIMCEREFRIAELKKENKELKASIADMEGRLKK